MTTDEIAQTDIAGRVIFTSRRAPKRLSLSLLVETQDAVDPSHEFA